jgi:teichuronic acid exporter
MLNLKKNKLFSNLLATLSGKFGTMSIQLVTTIILARFLTPKDFGIVAMCAIFLSISEMLIDSGMAGSIIYYKDVKEIELHTLFWTNIFISILIYILLFLISGWVASFYEVAVLKDIIKVIGLSVIIHSFCLIQSALMSKELLFKLQSKILVFSAILSSIVVVCMALSQLGFWALVIQPISFKIFQVFFYFLYGSYKPKLKFSLGSLKRHWLFGSRLLGSSMLKLIYDNIYVQIIGKVINIGDAGFYSQAQRFNDIPTKLITYPLERVIFPDLVRSNNMIDKMKKIAIIFSLVIIPMLFLGSLLADNLILILLGKKWFNSGWMLSFLFLGAIGASLEALNRNFLKASGRTNVLLKFDIYKRIINVIVLIIGMYWALKGILIAFIVNGTLGWLINAYALSSVVNYSFKDQVLKTLSIVGVSIIPYMVIMMFFGDLQIINNVMSTILKIIIYLILFLPLLYLFQKKPIEKVLESLNFKK